MLAVAAAAGDDRAIDRIAAAGPDMRRAIEAEIDRVIEEQRLALEERRREAGVTVAVNSPRPDKAIWPRARARTRIHGHGWPDARPFSAARLSASARWKAG